MNATFDYDFTKRRAVILINGREVPPVDREPDDWREFSLPLRCRPDRETIENMARDLASGPHGWCYRIKWTERAAFLTFYRADITRRYLRCADVKTLHAAPRCQPSTPNRSVAV